MISTPRKPSSRLRWPWILGACVPVVILIALGETALSTWFRAAIASFAVVFFGVARDAMKRGE
jgi:hypothetical protein